MSQDGAMLMTYAAELNWCWTQAIMVDALETWYTPHCRCKSTQSSRRRLALEQALIMMTIAHALVVDALDA